MAERPILFSGAMVRAILEGRKTQTRRVISDKHEWARSNAVRGECWLSPFGVRGDRLWVRETHAGDNLCGWVYRADHPDADIRAGELDDGEQTLRRWTPAIHMPRAACRLMLDVVTVRVERLQEISEEDAIAEGVRPPGDYGRAPNVAVYRALWDSLNAKRGYGWDVNPWVWVIEFRRTRADTPR